MKKKGLLLIAFLSFASFSLAGQEVKVLKNQNTVWTFPYIVNDFHMDESDKEIYEVKKIKRSVIIKVKKGQSKEMNGKTTLTVYYGDEGQFTFVADIFPSDDAPSHWEFDTLKGCLVAKDKTIAPFQEKAHKDREEPVGVSVSLKTSNSQWESIFKEMKQQYWDLGIQEGGVTVMVPKIVLLGRDETLIEIWILNKTQTYLKLQPAKIENISYKWKYLIWRERVAKSVWGENNKSAPSSQPGMEVAPQNQESFIFSFPTFISEGGIDITLCEDPKKGYREYKFNIPVSVILEAERR